MSKLVDQISSAELAMTLKTRYRSFCPVRSVERKSERPHTAVMLHGLGTTCEELVQSAVRWVLKIKNDDCVGLLDGEVIKLYFYA
jgi:hypothetical protein